MNFPSLPSSPVWEMAPGVERCPSACVSTDTFETHYSPVTVALQQQHNFCYRHIRVVLQPCYSDITTTVPPLLQSLWVTLQFCYSEITATIQPVAITFAIMLQLCYSYISYCYTLIRVTYSQFSLLLLHHTQVSNH